MAHYRHCLRCLLVGSILCRRHRRERIAELEARIAADEAALRALIAR